MGIFSLLILCGIIQCVFFLVIISFSRYSMSKENHLLRLILLVLCFILIPQFFYQSGLVHYFPHFELTGYPLIFLLGPLFYLYTRTYLYNSYYLSPNLYSHFIPALLCICILLPYYCLPGDQKLEVIEHSNFLMAIQPILSSLHVIHILAYLVLSMRYLKRMKSFFLIKYHKKTRWLKLLFTGQFFIILLYIISFHFNGQVVFNLKPPVLMAIVISVTVYFMIYKAIRHQIDVSKSSVKKESDLQPHVNLTDEEVIDYLEKLEHIMVTSKPFIDNSLTIYELSKISAIPRYKISYILNSKLQINFCDFVNFYRIQECKKKLLNEEWQHYTILSIAQEVGFKSKSVFNNAFKKFTNQTPSEFLEKNRLYLSKN